MGVVVGEADAHHAARFFDAEAFGQVEGIIIAAPHTNTGFAEAFGGGVWVFAIEAYAEGGGALVNAGWVGDAIHLAAANFAQASQHVAAEVGFVILNRLQGLMQGLGAGTAEIARDFGWVGLAEPFEIGHCAVQASHMLMVLGSGFKFAGQGIVGGAHFVGRQAFEQSLAPVDHAHVGGEEFVGGAAEKIAAEVLHIDGGVRGVMHRIEEGERPDGLGHADDLLERVDGADGV